jgi:hypothetical protein
MVRDFSKNGRFLARFFFFASLCLRVFAFASVFDCGIAALGPSVSHRWQSFLTAIQLILFSLLVVPVFHQLVVFACQIVELGNRVISLIGQLLDINTRLLDGRIALSDRRYPF